MEIRLIRLELKNFKGLRDTEFYPDGKNAEVYGDNATGKTTIYDGFLWLLTGKDSAGKDVKSGSSCVCWTSSCRLFFPWNGSVPVSSSWKTMARLYWSACRLSLPWKSSGAA